MRNKNIEISTKDDGISVIVFPDNTVSVNGAKFHLDNDFGFEQFIKIIRKIERADIRNTMKEVLGINENIF